MSKLERAVQDLAIALEDLSVRVQKSSLSASERTERLVSIQSQASMAQNHAGKAARELAGTIESLKAMIAKAEAGDSSDTPDSSA